MDRYELVEGTSAKFWEVGVTDAVLTVRFGRIGTEGQSKDKTFGDASAAIKERDKLVKEKVGKGYALTGSVAAPAAKAAVQQPSQKPGRPADVVAAPVMATAASASAATGAILPSAIVPESTSARAAPLATRTRPSAAMSAGEAWEGMRTLAKSLLAGGRAGQPDAVAWLEQALDAPPVAPAGGGDVAGWFRVIEAVGTEGMPEGHWRTRGEEQARRRECLRLLAHWIVASAGAVRLAEGLDLLRPEGNARGYYRECSLSDPSHLGMRDAIVTAPQEAYEHAIRLLTERSDGAPWPVRAAFAFVVADDRAADHPLKAESVLRDAEAAGAKVQTERPYFPLVADVRPSAAARWRVRSADLAYMCYFDTDPAEVAATLVAVAGADREAATPGLSWLFATSRDAERTIVATALLETREEAAFDVVLASLHEKPVRAAFDAAEAACPEWVIGRSVASLAAGRNEPALLGRVAEALGRHGEQTLRRWGIAASPRAAAWLDKFVAERDVGEAPEGSWPAVLRDPPWRKGRASVTDLVLDLTPVPTPFAFDPSALPKWYDYSWRTNQGRMVDMSDLATILTELEGQPVQSYWPVPQPEGPVPRDTEGALAWLRTRIGQLTGARFGMHSSGLKRLYDKMEMQPEPLSLLLWEQAGGVRAAGVPLAEATAAMMSRFGERALPGFLGLVASAPLETLEIALAVDSAGIAPLAAKALLRTKKAKTPALAWLRRHRGTAMLSLVPASVGKPGAGRDEAEHALRSLALDAPDGRADLDEAVGATSKANGGVDVATALAQVLGRDALERFPARVPKTPAWLSVENLSKPVLADGSGALPAAAVTAFLEALSFSLPEEVYAGIGIVRDACSRPSLAAFSWDLFSAWIAAGAPAKDAWAFRAVGWLGDDDSVRKLTRLIRKWPGEAAHARAVTGLDVLVDVGTDVALMNLNGIAEKLKFKGLQEKAREKIAALAEARDLSPEELSDRLAPDLDLDERGGQDLDFGPRFFRVAFDEFLKPVVKEPSGQRLKDLPKPNKADDPEKSAAAVARWAALRKDAKAVGTLQVARLEAMLSTSRRVRPSVFRAFFADHPLVRHLVQRLVWGIYPDADPQSLPTGSFRVGDDLAMTGPEDDLFELDRSENAPGLVGILHPIQMGESLLQQWGQVFGDYEIAQPFPQLGRETYAFTTAEKSKAETDRFKGVVVESKRLRGMGAKGWPLGGPQDGGCIHWMERKVRLEDGRSIVAHLYFGDGLMTGAPEYEPEDQTIEMLTLYDHWLGQKGSGATLGDLDPVTASEMLRGPTLLTAHAKS